MRLGPRGWACVPSESAHLHVPVPLAWVCLVSSVHLPRCLSECALPGPRVLPGSWWVRVYVKAQLEAGKWVPCFGSSTLLACFYPCLLLLFTHSLLPGPRCRVWLDGLERMADESTGQVVLPYRDNVAQGSLVMGDAAGFAALAYGFVHRDECYVLATGQWGWFRSVPCLGRCWDLAVQVPTLMGCAPVGVRGRDTAAESRVPLNCSNMPLWHCFTVR